MNNKQPQRYHHYNQPPSYNFTSSQGRIDHRAQRSPIQHQSMNQQANTKSQRQTRVSDMRHQQSHGGMNTTKSNSQTNSRPIGVKQELNTRSTISYKEGQNPYARHPTTTSGQKHQQNLQSETSGSRKTSPKYSNQIQSQYRQGNQSSNGISSNNSHQYGLSKDASHTSMMTQQRGLQDQNALMAQNSRSIRSGNSANTSNSHQNPIRNSSQPEYYRQHMSSNGGTLNTQSSGNRTLKQQSGVVYQKQDSTQANITIFGQQQQNQKGDHSPQLKNYQYHGSHTQNTQNSARLSSKGQYSSQKMNSLPTHRLTSPSTGNPDSQQQQIDSHQQHAMGAQSNQNNFQKSGNFFRRNTSNQSGKNQQKGAPVQNPGMVVSNHMSNQGVITQKHSNGIPSRQSSGGPNSHQTGIHNQGHHGGMHHGGNNQKVPSQAPPGSHYNPKTKMIQIGQSTSPKVSPKNIKELLKFRVSHANQSSTSVSITATGNGQQQVGGNQGNAMNSNQQANGNIVIQDGIRNRKQTVGTTYSQNQEIHHFQSNKMQQPGLRDSLPSGTTSNKFAHLGQQSPIMPGNGNSQVNYQQRKSLKKTSSNEQYKGQGGQQQTPQQYAQQTAASNSRVNSVNSSQNEPTKFQHHGTPMTQNYISRPTSTGTNHGSGVIQHPGQGQIPYNHNQQYRSNNMVQQQYNRGPSAHHNQKYSTSSAQTSQASLLNPPVMASGGTNFQNPHGAGQITHEQLQEQIQKLIKNNKKHFSKDQDAELHKYLKQVLTQYLEAGQQQNQNLNIPNKNNDKQGFNDLINELIRINQPLIGGNQIQGNNGLSNRMKSGKDRAHSEKTAQQMNQGQPNQTGQPPNNQGYMHQNPHHHAQGNYTQVPQQVQHQPPQKGQISVNANTQKKQKTNMQKPTINLSINNNVQNLIVTPMGAGQYPNQGQAVQQQQNNQQVVPGASNQNNLILGQAKQKRTSSEDNVNIQQQMNNQRQQAIQQQQQQQQLQQQQMQQMQYNQSNQVYPQKFGSHGHAGNGNHESPMVVKHRKNLPSLNNQTENTQGSHQNARSNSKGNGSLNGGSRGISNDSSVPMAIQIQHNTNSTNVSGGAAAFLNAGSRENSQASAGGNSHQKVVYTNGSNQKSNYGENGNIQINQVNSSSSNQGQIKNSSGSTTVTSSKPTIKVDDTIIQEKDQLIKYIKQYIKKNNELPPTTLNFYKFVKLIGKGAFGKVTLGVHKLTGKQVAIKTIEKNYMQDDFSKRKVFQEVYLLKKIKHSNVIRLLEVFESSKHLLMVMEYAGGGDLLRLIKRKGKLQESDAKFIFKQIAYGLAHIHCRSVIHRDIKLDNILLDCEKGVKICDFGVSKIIKKGQVIQEQCGTPAYLAPEIIIDKGYEGFFVDIWSLGVLLFAMLCGTVPFKASNLEDLHKLILKGDFNFPCELSSEAQSLVRGMIQLEPKGRLTIPQILSHAWLKETNEDESDEEDEDNNNDEDGKDNNAVAGNAGNNKQSDIDLKNIQGNVNYVNVDNLFYHENYKIKLSYTDYCCITEDFSTENIDEEALTVCENFGFPRQFLIKCLNRGDINHATACYYLETNAG